MPHLFERRVGDLPVESRHAGIVRKLQQRPDGLERDPLIGGIEVVDELLKDRVQFGIPAWAYDTTSGTWRALRGHG